MLSLSIGARFPYGKKTYGSDSPELAPPLRVLAELYQAQGRTEEALGILEAPNQPDWAQFFLRYHRALLTDVAEFVQGLRRERSA